MWGRGDAGVDRSHGTIPGKANAKGLPKAPAYHVLRVYFGDGF